MKVGFNQWKNSTPKKIKYIAGILLTAATAIGGWGFWATVPVLQHIAGGCFFVGTMLPVLFGVEGKEDDKVVAE